MSQKRIQQIEQRIDRIKRALLEIGPIPANTRIPNTTPGPIGRSAIPVR
jgi:hypothetical protein